MREQIAGTRAIASVVAVCRLAVACAHPISLQEHVVEAAPRNAYSQTPLHRDGSEE